MAPGSIGLDAYTRTRNAISSLIVAQLKAVLKAVHQPVSGTKGLLVNRLEICLQEIYARNDVTGFQRLTDLITQPSGSVAMHTPSSTSYSHQSQSASYATPPSWHSNTNSHGIVQLNFKDSVFFEPVARLTGVQTLKAMEQTRSTHEFTCNLQPEWAAKFDRGAPDRDSYRLLLMGASDPVATFVKLDIAYPQQFEVKINGTDVRGNWKGLKNKPGTTKPVDITEFLRKTNGYDNSITITYALTKQRFHLRVDLVKEQSPTSLVLRLRDGRTISKERVLRDMRNKAMDTDIVTTSSVMSLKCPITYTRLKSPCRGNQCNHNQCFDAMSYLQLQQQAPTWTCPVCNKPATFDNLQIDQYVADILQSVSEDVEQVTIQPDGQWTRVDPNDNNRGNTGVKSEDESEDDLVEIKTPTNDRLASMSRTPAMSNTTNTTNSTPQPQSTGQTSGASSSRNANNKRPHEVVDLTLDSSDDDSPPPPKRVAGPIPLNPQLPPGYGQHHNASLSNGHRQSNSGINFPMPVNRSNHPSAQPYNMHQGGAYH